jgi:hypothetical protein
VPSNKAAPINAFRPRPEDDFGDSDDGGWRGFLLIMRALGDVATAAHRAKKFHRIARTVLVPEVRW